MYFVAIVGRPNVGKSTFFNRLVQYKKAIVDNESGVTRDRQYGEVDWNGKDFQIIDTGGFVFNSSESFSQEINNQISIAINESQAIIFMVDAKEGITTMDEEIVSILRTVPKPVYLVVNKIDNQNDRFSAQEFYSLGYNDVFFINSINGSGTGELLDTIVEKINKPSLVESIENLPKLAIIGQPNVGKSSLLNTLLEEERTIVSSVSGTTRDSIYTHFKKFDKEFILIDTAGIRKKNSPKKDLEFYSIIRAFKAIDQADVCLLMIDAKQGLTAQDINLFSVASRRGKGLIIVVNKWDLINKQTNTIKDLTELMKNKLAPFNDVPFIFVSVIAKQRLIKLLDLATEVAKNRKSKIPTSLLNETLLKTIEAHPAPVVRGHTIKIKYITQLNTSTPCFAFFTNFPNDIKLPYKQYLINLIRKNFNFCGVPIRIVFKKK